MSDTKTVQQPQLPAPVASDEKPKATPDADVKSAPVPAPRKRGVPYTDVHGNVRVDH